MAIEKTIAKRTMNINVKDTAADADIFAVGTAIAGLINKELSDISITEKSMLSEVM